MFELSKALFCMGCLGVQGLRLRWQVEVEFLSL